MPDVVLTKKEQQAIAELEKLAKKWPQTLELFSWSGSLRVFKKDANGVDCDVGGVIGIPNDGGDPDDVNCDPKIEYK